MIVFLAVLFVAGQLAALRLVSAPRFAVYQHLADWPDLFATAPWAVAILVVQAAVCLALAWRERAGVLRIPRALLPGWRLPAMLALLAFAAAVPTGTAPRFGREVVLALVIAGLAALNLALLVGAIPEEGARRFWARLTSGEGLGSGRTALDRRLPWLLAGWTTIAAAVIACVVFERLPHIDDGVSYLFQAKTFAAGHLWLPAPPDSAAFHVDQVIVDRGHWFGYGFPGWAAVLSLGIRLGAPWLVNPLLAGLTVLLTHALVRTLYDRATAHAVAGLLAFSPWFLFTAGEFMGQPLSGVLTLGILIAIARAREAPGGKWGAIAGLLMGALALSRPLDAAILSLPAALWSLGLGARRLHVSDIVAGILAASVVGTLVPTYNHAMTGNASYPAHNMWMDRTWGPGRDRLGFGPDVGNNAWPQIDPLPGHGAADVVLNLNKNVFQAGADLFGWACGSLLMLALWLLLGRWRRPDAISAAVIAAFAAGYSLYWFSGGPDLGPRYWYAALVPFVILSARGVQVVAARLEELNGTRRWRLAAFAALASLGATATMLPWRAATKYYHYRNVSGAVRTLANDHAFGRSLVLIRGVRREDYQSGFSLNPADLEAPVPIYAWDKPGSNIAAVVSHYRDRPIWIVGRRDSTVPRLDVLAGPLPPGTNLP